MAQALDIISYRPSWQKLRCSTLTESNPYGGMLTPDGATDAINRMTNYINDARPTSNYPPEYVSEELARMNITLEEEHACRVYRVYTFLQATVNGLISQPGLNHMQAIKQTAAKLRGQINMPAVQRAANKWNWEVVRFELETLWREDRMWFIEIYNDMKERYQEKGKDSPQMLKFIGMMNQVNSIGR